MRGQKLEKLCDRRGPDRLTLESSDPHPTPHGVGLLEGVAGPESERRRDTHVDPRARPPSGRCSESARRRDRGEAAIVVVVVVVVRRERRRGNELPRRRRAPIERRRRRAFLVAVFEIQVGEMISRGNLPPARRALAIVISESFRGGGVRRGRPRWNGDGVAPRDDDGIRRRRQQRRRRRQ